MHRTIEAIIETDGHVRLLEAIAVEAPRRALLTILDEPAEDMAHLTALLSETALAEWNRPEEDEAWSHLQTEP